jgi:UDP-N-acetylglucosamine acyltransferase
MDVEIGAYAVVGKGVCLGSGTRLLAHAVVLGPAVLGRENVVHSFAVLGGEPQHKRAVPPGESRLVIGDRNVFREHTTAHRGDGTSAADGTSPALPERGRNLGPERGRNQRPRRGHHQSDGATRIGDDNLFMVGSHVAHDVLVGSSCTFANAVQIAGHARVEDHATFGGLSGVAQFVVVGQSAFVAAGAMCEARVPPFVIVQGDRARVRGLNLVGLRRRGVPEESVLRLEKAFRMLFGKKMPRAEAIRNVERGDAFVDALLLALESSVATA